MDNTNKEDEIIPWDEWVGVIEPYYPGNVKKCETIRNFV